jgi:hypothetical protein
MDSTRILDRRNTQLCFKMFFKDKRMEDNIKMDLVFPLTSEISRKVYLYGAQPQRIQDPSHMRTASHENGTLLPANKERRSFC